MPEQLSVYFHWPYCKSKCPYCDFFKYVRKDIPQEEIIKTYIQELNFYHQMMPNRQIRSIFFGGGTPSLIRPAYVGQLIDHTAKLWPMVQKPEISLEANPNSEYPDMFRLLRLAGINRLSLGVQALNESDLRFLGRTHSLKQALHSIEEVLKNFENHSMDLIYARRSQTLLAWEKECRQAVSFGFKHLSLYQLSIEEGTFFAAKNVLPADEDTAAEMYDQTVELMRANGYPRYEVSNFAPYDYESVHNKCYWYGDDYIGIGESAHGRLKIKNRHYALEHPHRLEALTNRERAEELIIMGLRLQEGIDKTRFEKICGLKFDSFINKTALAELVCGGYLRDSAQSCAPTDKGFLVLDKIIEELQS